MRMVCKKPQKNVLVLQRMRIKFNGETLLLGMAGG